MTRLEQQAETGRHLRTINIKSGEDFGAGRLMRGLLERPGGSGVPEGSVPGKRAFRERGRRRTRQDQISYRALAPVKLRVVKDTRTERRKPVSSAGPVLKERASFERTLFRNTIQPFDLMSRRHPLFVDQSLQTFIRGSCDVPASSRRQFLEKRSYFFFFATLRVFFAVFFTALFAFFAFFAFLAMLPS